MARDASGNVTLTASSVNPAAPLTQISSADFNALTTQYVALLTDSLSRSGLGGMSADLDIGGNQITSLGSPSASGDAANKNYVDTGISAVASTVSTLDGAALKKDGSVALTANWSAGGFKITSVGTPTSGGDAVNKTYADNAAAGVLPHDPVRFVAITGTLATGFDNGKSAGGVTVATGDRFGYFPAAGSVDTGVYIAAASGAPTRATDLDAGSEFTPRPTVAVSAGTYVGSVWRCANLTQPVVGVDTITFVQSQVGGQTYSATNGVAQSGNIFSLDLSYSTVWTVPQSISITGNNTPGLTITGTQNDNARTGNIYLRRLRGGGAAGQDGDGLNSIAWGGLNSASAEKVFMQFKPRILSAVAGAESGLATISALLAGVDTEEITIGSGITAGAPAGGQKGTGAINCQLLYENDDRVATWARAHSVTDAAIARTLDAFQGMDLINAITHGGADPNNSTVNFNAAMDTCVALAKTRTRACIVIPNGVYRAEASELVVDYPLTSPGDGGIAIVGYGSGRYGAKVRTQNNGNWIRVGNQGSAETKSIKLAHFVLEGSGTINTGQAISVTKARFTQIEDMWIQGHSEILGLGVGATADDDTKDTQVRSCYFQQNATNNKSMIRLVSGAVLHLSDIKAVAGGSIATQHFMTQELTGGTDYNFDGINLVNFTGEGFNRVIYCEALGISNVQMTNFICDVLSEAFRIRPKNGGECKLWTVGNGQIGTGGIPIGQPATVDDNSALLRTTAVAGSTVRTIKFYGISCLNLNARSVDIEADCGVSLHQIDFLNCSPGLPLIRHAGYAGNVVGCHGERSTGTAFTNVLSWVAPSDPNGRAASANTGVGGSGAIVTGAA